MANLNRRQALTLGAGAVAAVGIVSATVGATSLSSLIEGHKVAYLDFHRALAQESALDRLEMETGSPQAGQDEAAQEVDRAGDAETDAFEALCQYRCRSMDENRTKAAYMLSTAIVADTWTDEARDLLRSFL